MQSIINKAVKEYNYSAIDEYYNKSLSVAENLKVLQDNGVKVCSKTLYNYCKDRGIKVCYSDSEIIAMINANDSVRGNLATLKDNGVKIGSKRIAKLLKQLKEGRASVNEASDTIVSGSNSQKVTDTTNNIDYRKSIIPKDYKITTPNTTSTIPTQNDIIDEMEAYLMKLENEINNT